ncbi:MAG: VanW family protein [Proteobacteria bacterium]|nr:VanW family protein [Pseudomonadota bacterium]
MGVFRRYIPFIFVLIGAVGCQDAFTPSNERPLDLSQTDHGVAAAASDAHCERVHRRSIQIHEPTLDASYDLEMLGVIHVAFDKADANACLDAAILDGAEIISRTDTELVAFYPTRFEAFVDAARERIDIDVVEGRWSDALQRVIPGVTGRKLNAEATYRAFREAIQSDADSFAVVIDETPALSNDLHSMGEFKPSVLIGEYRTVFSKSKNRTINVKLAAASCDGVFLMPGAEFSYNEWVGERSEARGFKEAPVIEQGQVVEGLGGGACQVSSTIHAAALLSGIGILERYNHSLPSSYIPVGMDAVVSYPMLDLRLKNTFERPVVLRVHTEDNTLIAQFFSDAPRPAKVMFRREVTEEIPFKETITVDPTLEPGTIKIKKRGKVGYKVQRGRIFIEDGKERFEKLLADTYHAQTQQTFIAMDVVYPPPAADEE